MTRVMTSTENKMSYLKTILLWSFLTELNRSWAKTKHGDWHYAVGQPGGPDYWYINYTECGSVMQSPIDINTSRVAYDAELQPFNFNDYYITEGVEMELHNLGFTAQVYMKGKELNLTGGSLPGKYHLMMIHFHWRGEHLIDGQFHPAEIHFVHGRQGLQASDALRKPYGLAVTGFFFKEGKKNNDYEPLLSQFSHIRPSRTKINITTFPISQLLPNASRFDFFRYFGSLTTPPCKETVIWSVFEPVIELSKEQLEVFKTIFDDDENELTDTWRPVQTLNYRTVLTTNVNYSQPVENPCINSICPLRPGTFYFWVLTFLFEQWF